MWWLILVIILVGWAVVNTLEKNKRKELDLKEKELKLKREELALNPEYRKRQELKEIAQRANWENLMVEWGNAQKNAKNSDEKKHVDDRFLNKMRDLFREN